MQTMERRTTTATRAPKKTESRELKQIKEAKETFAIYAPEAQSVELVGNFTDWEQSPIALKKSKDGTWKAAVSLGAGTYEYRFKVDGQWRNDPDCPRRTTNPYGEENCIREVA
jgi:1,4-alpha-glucan branching enzyme